MIWWHKVGQKVVCVEDTFDPNPTYKDKEIYPKLDEIYTIREITVDSENEITFKLKEIINPKLLYRFGYGELKFFTWHFEPVKETSIECFKSMLNPTPEQIKEYDCENEKEKELV